MGYWIMMASRSYSWGDNFAASRNSGDRCSSLRNNCLPGIQLLVINKMGTPSLASGGQFHLTCQVSEGITPLTTAMLSRVRFKYSPPEA